MRLSLRSVVFWTALWTAQSVWACPEPTMVWSPNPVCVGCQSVLTLDHTDVAGYVVTDGPWVDSIIILPTSNSPTAAGTIYNNVTNAVIDWTDPGFCSVVVTSKLDWFCASNNTSGTSTNFSTTPFTVARMEIFKLTDAGNTNRSKQDTTDDDATPTDNLLILAEDTNGNARVILNLTRTPTNANVGNLFKWQISGNGWSPASGNFSAGTITSVWTDAGGTVDREFTVTVQCDCGPGGDCENCAQKRMLKIAVLKIDIEQAETNVCWKMTNAVLNLTTNSFWADAAGGSVVWSSEPAGKLGGVGYNNSNFWFNPRSSTPTTYVVTARSSLLPNCYDTCTVRVVKVDLDGQELQSPPPPQNWKDVPDDQEVNPGVLLVSAKTRLLVQNPGANVGKYKLTWTDPAPNKHLKLVGTNGPNSPIEVDCAGPWPKEYMAVAAGNWDFSDAVEVTLTHSLVDCSDVVKLVVLKVDVNINLVDEEPVPDPRAAIRDASDLDMSTLSVTLNGNAVDTSIMTITDIISGILVVGKKLQFTAPCSMLNLPGSNEVKANINDIAGNPMDQVTQTFSLP